MMKSFCVAAALALSAVSVQAATVLVDGSVVSEGEPLSSGSVSSVTYDYTVATSLVISDIAIGGFGFFATDLAKITFTVDGVDYTYDTISADFPSIGAGIIDGFTADSDFSIVVTADSTTFQTGFSFDFTASAATADVPLPAAGGLLIVSLAGLAMMRKRKTRLT